MNKQIVYFLKSILVALVLMLFTACATSMPVETPKEAIFVSDKPLVQAKLNKVLIDPFTKEARKIWFLEKSFILAEKDLSNKLSRLLRSHGIFKISAEDFIEVKAKPISMNDPTEGLFSTLAELIVKYEFSTDKGDLILTETITSRGTSRAPSGVVRVEESIKNAVSANVAKLSHVIKQKLPGAWRSYVEKREVMRQRIAANLKRDDRYFRVISAKATVRNMPNASAKEVASLPQADLVHVTGSLPTGWLQVSREGKNIGWIHSSLLKEDLATATSYRPAQQVLGYGEGSVSNQSQASKTSVHIAYPKEGEHIADDQVTLLGYVTSVNKTESLKLFVNQKRQFVDELWRDTPLNVVGLRGYPLDLSVPIEKGKNVIEIRVLDKEGFVVNHKIEVNRIEIAETQVASAISLGERLPDLDIKPQNKQVNENNFAVVIEDWVKQTAVSDYNKGNRMYDDGRLERAVYYYRKAVRTNPLTPAFFNLGLALQGLGNENDARQAFEKACEQKEQRACAMISR